MVTLIERLDVYDLFAKANSIIWKVFRNSTSSRDFQSFVLLFTYQGRVVICIVKVVVLFP